MINLDIKESDDVYLLVKLVFIQGAGAALHCNQEAGCQEKQQAAPGQ